MPIKGNLYLRLLSGAAIAAVMSASASAQAATFNIPPKALDAALDDFSSQSHQPVVATGELISGKASGGAAGAVDAPAALSQLLRGTGLTYTRSGKAYVIVKAENSQAGLSRVAMQSAPEFAQPSAPLRAAEVSTVQEIVVTANRTASLASKTPITLTAISGESLSSAGISNPTQLASAAPGIMLERGNANGLQINVRGIQSNGGQPSVAFLVDGIYIGNPTAQEVSFFDLDRIEVLRGPQGTLYGRNTPAGVVNVISKAPTSQLGGSVDVGYGSYNNFQATGVFNAPVSDKLAFRLAANYLIRDSFYTQDVPQAYATPRDKDNKSARLSTLYTPTDNFRALIILDYTSMSGAGNGFGAFPLLSNFYKVPLPFPANGMRTASPTYLDPSPSRALSKTYADDHPSDQADDTWGIAADLSWKITDNLTATYLGSHREYERNDRGTTFFGSEIVGSKINNLTQAISINLLEQAQSHELRLALDNGPLKAQAGAYYFNQSGKNFQDFSFFQSSNPSYYDRSIGVFGQATYSLTDRWRLTGGLRYTKDKSGAVTSGTYEGSKVTWKLNTDYDLAPNVMAYATVATGYKGGALNQNCSQISVSCAYRPEGVTDYEVGLKGRFFNNHLSLNAAGFHYDYNDLQISQVVPLLNNLGATVATTNAAAAKVDGVELEGIYRVTQNSRIDFAAAWLNARYANFVIQPSNPRSDNYNGEPLDHAPTWTLSAGYTYTQPLANGGELVANIRTRFVDSYAMLSAVVNTLFIQPSFTKSDLTVRYNAPEAKWYIEAFAHNMENTIDVTYVNTAPLFGSGLPWNNNGKVSTGDPRTFGVRTGLKF